MPRPRTRPKAAGSLALVLTLGCGESGIVPADSGIEPADADTNADTNADDPHAAMRERLAAWEAARREQIDFGDLPASDGRFGSDPYRMLGLPDGRIAVLLRGADRLVLLDHELAITATATTPHDPTDLIWRGREAELWVVGTGEARVARYADATLDPRPDVPLRGGLSPRTLAAADAWVFVADEASASLHALQLTAAGTVEARAPQPYCHGPLALAVHDDLLIGNCLLEHRLRVDRLADDGALLGVELDGIEHDGPIWSFALGPRTADGETLLALTGVEDRPLDRSDGAFGYIDSFAWIYALRREADGGASFERRASVNLSEQGVVTPKWSMWAGDDTPTPTLIAAGYGSAPLLELRWATGFDAPPQITARPSLPGTRDALWLDPQRILATDPLLDRLVLLEPEQVRSHALALELPEDDRSFAERLGEALVFTTAMAPHNVADGRRSRFTCETCHFEGRGDGRVHFTGRERDGEKIHAVSKTLQGLFNNRPHFSRALDRTSATMVENEFRVANRHSELDPHFTLTPELVPWITTLEGWSGVAGGSVNDEALRLAVLAFLLRYTPPRNPAVAGRRHYDTLEAEGARLFMQHCERCHQARLSTDDASTRLPASAWETAIFSSNTPVVWASDAYVQTGIEPWVHPDGARVPSLRRITLDWPYFTSGVADGLTAVLEGCRISSADTGDCDHQIGPPLDSAQGLDPSARAALLAFLRLL